MSSGFPPVERIELDLSILPFFHLSLGKALPSAGVGGLTFTFDGIGWSRDDLRARLSGFDPGMEALVTARDGLNPRVLHLSIDLSQGEPSVAQILDLLRRIIAHLIGG